MLKLIDFGIAEHRRAQADLPQFHARHWHAQLHFAQQVKGKRGDARSISTPWASFSMKCSPVSFASQALISGGDE